MKKTSFDKFFILLVTALILIFPSNHLAQAQSSEFLTILNPTPQDSDAFGWGASLDGNKVVIGAPTDDYGAFDSGTAHLFDTSGNLLRTFNNPSPQVGDLFGDSVSISGNKVIIGAFLDDIGIASNAGSAYLFDATTGNLLQTFNNPSPDSGDLFGRSVSIYGNNILIGAPFDDTGAIDAGIAYLFDATTGSLLQTFTNPTPGNSDIFGHLVSISGNKILIAADGDNTGNPQTGSAYLFDATTGNLLRTFNNPVPDAGDRFGTSVNISGNNILIGAPFDDTGAIDAGIAYLFDATTGSLLQTFTNPTPAISELFGYQGYSSGNNIVLSAINDDTGATNAGIAYLFDATTGGILRIYPNPTPESNENFGTIVSMSSNKVLIGAPRDNSGAIATGTAYLIFEPTTDSDGDKIPNVLDNCINISNQGQEDIDNDRIGNVCDSLHLISKDTTINTLFVVQTGQTMQIEPNTILNNFYKIIIAGTLNNAGIINNQPDTRLINIGTGIINNNAGGTITNGVGSVIVNDGGGIIKNTSGDTIMNSGVIINVGNSIINNNGPGKITNNNGGLVLNDASSINNNAGGQIVSNTGSLIVTRAAGTITNSLGSTININGGSIVNQGAGTIRNNVGGIISLTGGIIFNQMASINNAGGVITSSGIIISTGTGANTVNSGSITNNVGAIFINDDTSTITNNHASTITNNGGRTVNTDGSTINNNSGALIKNTNGGISFDGTDSTLTNNAGATIDITDGVWYNECGGTVNNLGTILGSIIYLLCT